MTSQKPLINQFLELPYYLQVQGVNVLGPGRLDCLALNHRESGTIVITQSLLENHALHLNNGIYEDKLTKTQLAAEFAEVPPRRLLQVCFVKKDGSDRILTGYRVSNEDNPLGMSMVHDLEVMEGNPLRNVDHRTIKWFVAASQNPVKLVLKGN